MKLFEKVRMNRSIVELMCRNSRQPEWLRSDLLALISVCRTAALGLDLKFMQLLPRSCLSVPGERLGR